MEEALPDGRRELKMTLERADEAQEDLERLFERLALSIDLTGDIEIDMIRSRATRDAALVRLGRQVLHWYRSGGGFILEPPERELATDEATKEAPLPEPLSEPLPVPPPEALPEETASPPAVAEPEPPVVAPPEPEPPKEAPPPAPLPVVPSEPASLESIQSLSDGGLGVNWSSAAPVTRSLDRILDALTPAPSETQIKSQLARIHEVNPHTWRGLPKNIQRDLTALLATWGRHIQDNLGAEHSTKLTAFFSRLTEFSELEQPGFVYGLARQHMPRGASWLEEALQVWRRLNPEELEPTITPELALTKLQGQLSRANIRPAVLDALSSGLQETDPRLIQLLSSRLSDLGDEPRLRKVRKAIRRHNSERDKRERQRQQQTQAPSWAHRSTTSTWRVIILGGDRPKKLSPLLKEKFSFADIRHESGKQMRRVHQLQQSISAGKINLCLIVTRFLSHKASNLIVDACNEHGVLVMKMGSGLNLVPLHEVLTTHLSDA